MIQSLSANEVEALESRIIGTLRKFLLKSLSVRHHFFNPYFRHFQEVKKPTVPKTCPKVMLQALKMSLF